MYKEFLKIIGRRIMNDKRITDDSALSWSHTPSDTIFIDSQ